MRNGSSAMEAALTEKRTFFSWANNGEGQPINSRVRNKLLSRMTGK